MTDSFGGLLFQIGPIFIGAVFVIVIGAFLFMAVKGLVTWSSNNAKPRLKTEAEVVSKRSDVRGGGETRARSIYFVTFESDSRDRMEFQVSGQEFGLLAEGDYGNLEFQGTRYIGFSRRKSR